MPVVILVARKLDLSLMKVGIPALAGLADIHDESDRLMEPSPMGGSSL